MGTSKADKELNIQVNGQMVFNTSYQMLQAARNGLGLAYLAIQMVREYIERSELALVLEDWNPTYVGFHLYYRSRQLKSVATALIIEALKNQLCL